PDSRSIERLPYLVSPIPHTVSVGRASSADTCRSHPPCHEADRSSRIVHRAKSPFRFPRLQAGRPLVDECVRFHKSRILLGSPPPRLLNQTASEFATLRFPARESCSRT